jgi:hypothetical protein
VFLLATQAGCAKKAKTERQTMTGAHNGSSGSSVVTGPWPGANQESDAQKQPGLAGTPGKEPWNIFYSTPLPAFGTRLQVSILGKGGRSFVNAAANWRGRQEMGFYNFVVPEDRCDLVRKVVERSNFARHASHGDLAPDTPYTSLGYNPHGKASEVVIFVSQPPAPVAEAMTAIETLADEIRQHPLFAIAGSAAWNQPRFRVGDALELTVTLRSVGEKAVTFDNPLGSTNPEWTSLRMVVALAKADGTLDWANEVAQVDVTQQDLLTTERRLPKGEPRIELAPGKELQFIVRRKFHMSPGFYKAIITYHGVDGGGAIIGGVLDMDLGRIEVTP